MFDRDLQHPQITSTLRTGYPQSPFSHCKDVFEISHQCSKCGTTIAEEQSKYSLCESCEYIALRRFKVLLTDKFTDAEREYIDACVEGVSLTEVEKIKDIKAVY